MKKILILEEKEVDMLTRVLSKTLDFYRDIFDEEKDISHKFEWGNLDKLTTKLLESGVEVSNEGILYNFIEGMYHLCETFPNNEKLEEIVRYFDVEF